MSSFFDTMLEFALGSVLPVRVQRCLESTGLRFAEGDTKPELKDAFAAREAEAVVSPSRSDVEVTTEIFWASLHGLAELERSGRIPPGTREQRVALVARGLLNF